jgi:hypothetical protein
VKAVPVIFWTHSLLIEIRLKDIQLKGSKIPTICFYTSINGEESLGLDSVVLDSFKEERKLYREQEIREGTGQR